MENIYPRLKEFCQDLGYEFQVVELRWGVRDEATDDHMTTELCLREVDWCNKLSTGPSFVIDSLQFCPDGYRIIVQPEKEYPFYFEVKGGQNDKYTPEKPLHQYEELFHPTVEIKEIELSSDNPGEINIDVEPVLDQDPKVAEDTDTEDS